VISVVVATYRRPHALARLLDALEAQTDAPPVEVVVVDDGSPATIWEEVRRLTASRHPTVHAIHRSRNGGPAAARNVGWRCAAGDLVAFTDDDCVPDPGWLAALARAASGDVGIVQGRTEPSPEQLGRRGPFSRTMNVESETGHYQTCNIAYRRTLLEALGGFDEAFRVAEDTDLAWRAKEAGARTTFAADALVRHDVSVSSFRARLRDTTTWSSIPLVVRRHPQLRDLVHRRWFWKESHPAALVAAAGLAVVGRPGAGRRARVAGLVLLAPYVRYRTSVAPLPGGPRRRLAAIPGALAVDLAEIAVMCRASVRHRSLLL
jgi:GT2 family glycosyltransferase